MLRILGTTLWLAFAGTLTFASALGAHSDDTELFEASENGLKTAPCQHGLRTLRITRALQSTELDRAAEELRMGLKCFPNDPGMQTLRARLLYAQGHTELARVVIDEVIGLWPESSAAVKLSAHWFYADNDFENAARDAAKVMTFLHTPDDVLFAVKVAKAQNNSRAGFAILQSALNRQDLDVYRVAGFDWAMSKADPQSALRFVPAHLPNNALGAKWWIRRGEAQLLANERVQARQSFSSAQTLLDGLRPHVKKRAAIAKLFRTLELKQDSL